MRDESNGEGQFSLLSSLIREKMCHFFVCSFLCVCFCGIVLMSYLKVTVAQRSCCLMFLFSLASGDA